MLVDIMRLRNYARAKALVQADSSTDETLKAAGISERLIIEVMDNIERQIREAPAKEAVIG